MRLEMLHDHGILGISFAINMRILYTIFTMDDISWIDAKYIDSICYKFIIFIGTYTSNETWY